RLGHGLRYQHVIKGIVVISRKSRQHFGMRTKKREFQKTAFFSSRTKNWQLGIQLTYPCLYGDFPPRHSTDEDIILFRKQQIPHSFDARGVGQRPEQRIGIQHQPHVSSPQMRQGYRVAGARQNHQEPSAFLPEYQDVFSAWHWLPE